MELWKSIGGYENLYMVSNLGKVKSFRRKKPIILNPSKSSGYYIVNLYKSKRMSSKNIHCLVWDAFSNSPKTENLIIDHIDGDKLNNNIDNLQLLSNRENIIKYHQKANNKYPTGVSKRKDRYHAHIQIDGKNIYLGSYKTPEEAGISYNKKLDEILYDCDNRSKGKSSGSSKK